jgi:polar amino acid transport system substrate-binding protein
MNRRTLRFLSLPLVAVMLSACTSTASPTPASTPTPAGSAAAAAANPTAGPCDKSKLSTLHDGMLTVGTDNPAYPPYYQPPASGNATAPWELGDPTNGQGFESAVAYAVAAKLGYSKSDVIWTVVSFDSSYSPGAKPFDIYLAQVSYTSDRAMQVDMSDGYYFVNQAVVSLKTNAIASAKTIADLKQYKLGAQQGTTAYDTIQDTIAPTNAAAVYNSNDAAIQALKAKQIDGLVVDLPTAFYITSAQLDGSVIVGQFPAATGTSAEHFSIVLPKDSGVTTCINSALASMKADGSLDQITKEWLSDKASAPIISQ